MVNGKPKHLTVWRCFLMPSKEWRYWIFRSSVENKSYSHPKRHVFGYSITFQKKKTVYIGVPFGVSLMLICLDNIVIEIIQNHPSHGPVNLDMSHTLHWWYIPLGGGFKDFLFSPLFGKIPILTNIFQMGWNHQLVPPLPLLHVQHEINTEETNHLLGTDYISPTIADFFWVDDFPV